MKNKKRKQKLHRTSVFCTETMAKQKGKKQLKHPTYIFSRKKEGKTNADTCHIRVTELVNRVFLSEKLDWYSMHSKGNTLRNVTASFRTYTLCILFIALNVCQNETYELNVTFLLQKIYIY